MSNDCSVKLDVVFLLSGDDGEVLAVFPGFAHDAICVVRYQHIGQHSACDLDFCKSAPEVKDPAVYADLKEELEQRGYNLNVISKDCLRDEKYADQRKRQLSPDS